VAGIIIHHTPKTSFQNTDDYEIWDWMYWGAGCAQIANIARLITAIKPVGSDVKVFRFIMAKRGQRIGGDWENVFERYFAHSKTADAHYWVEATVEQIAQVTGKIGKFKKLDLQKVLQYVPILEPKRKSLVQADVQHAFNVGKDVAKRALDELFDCGKIFEHRLPRTQGQAGPPAFGVSQTPPSADGDAPH
jgi:hypothetical protein